MPPFVCGGPLDRSFPTRAPPFTRSFPAIYYKLAPQGTSNDWKNVPGTAHTDKQIPISFPRTSSSIHPSGLLPSPTPQNLRQGLSVVVISLHSLLIEAKFSNCWVTLQMDQSNHRLRSKSECDTWPAATPGSPPPPPAKTSVINRLSEIIYV
jgi:hypothetical protein